MQHTFKGFSFDLPVPVYSADFNEITIDCIAYKYEPPKQDPYIFTEINAVWCKGIDIYPLLKSDLILMFDNPKASLFNLVLEYGEGVFSGKKLPGVQCLPLTVASRETSNDYREKLDGKKDYSIHVKRTFHQVHIEYPQHEVKNYYYRQELTDILIDGKPVDHYGAEISKKMHSIMADMTDERAQAYFEYYERERELLNTTDVSYLFRLANK